MNGYPRVAAASCTGSGPWRLSFTVRTSPSSSFRVAEMVVRGDPFVGTLRDSSGRTWQLWHSFAAVCPR